MSRYRLWAILKKEFRHIRRDHRTLFLVTLSPAIMLFAFAYLFAFEAQNVRIGVWDLDRSALSHEYIASVTADGKLSLRSRPTSYTAIHEAMMRGEIHLGVVIPAGFQADLAAGERSVVQVITDGSDAIIVGQALGRFRQRTGEFSQSLSERSAALTAPIVVQDQAWYNRGLLSTFSMVPGLIPIVMILPSLAVALAVTREKELGSFETLVATPVQPVEYLVGKLVPYVTYGTISAILAILVAILWFRVPLRGPAPDLVLMTVLFLFAMLGQSLFLAGLLTSQGTAMRIVLLAFFLPSFFMSGIILPVDLRSGPGQLVSTMLPATYFVQITRGAFLKAMGLPDLVVPTLYLFAIGLAAFGLSLLTFRKQVD